MISVDLLICHPGGHTTRRVTRKLTASRFNRAVAVLRGSLHPNLNVVTLAAWLS